MSSRLLQKVAKLQPKNRSDWTATLPKTQLDDLLELRAAYGADKLKDASGNAPTLASLWRLTCQEFGFKIARNTFSDWMRK